MSERHPGVYIPEDTVSLIVYFLAYSFVPQESCFASPSCWHYLGASESYKARHVKHLLYYLPQTPSKWYPLTETFTYMGVTEPGAVKTTPSCNALAPFHARAE